MWRSTPSVTRARTRSILLERISTSTRLDQAEDEHGNGRRPQGRSPQRHRGPERWVPWSSDCRVDEEASELGQDADEQARRGRVLDGGGKGRLVQEDVVEERHQRQDAAVSV